MPELKAVSVISRSHLPQARVLADSLAEHHDNARLSVVVVDGCEEDFDRDEPFETLSPLELGIDELELHRRALLFDSQGLISSLRPLAISHLLERGAGSAMLLDADLLVLAALPDLWSLAAEYGVLLSPHSLAPLGGSPGAWMEELFLRAGTFNGGMLGVGTSGAAFLRWMSARVSRDCVPDPERGLLYSQTWLNLVPVLFPHRVLRDEGVNLTAHGLAGRDLEGTLERPSLGRAPVRLFHFTGFDPRAPDVLCRYLPGAEGRLDGRPHVAALCSAYADRLRARGWPVPDEYGWAHLPGGLAVDQATRGLYRAALLASERGIGDVPPDPFDRHRPEEFVDWLGYPPAELSHAEAGEGDR